MPDPQSHAAELVSRWLQNGTEQAVVVLDPAGIVSAIRDPAGEIVGFLKVMRDLPALPEAG